MNARQEKLVTKIVEEYIRTAQPVASGLLVKKCKLSLSSATVRHEMIELEKEGYVCQPHIAAGRIPTEKAYNFYLGNSLKLVDEKKFIDNKLVKIFESKIEQNLKLKEIAKKIADLTGETLIIAFAPNDFYYTGISNLFNHPEFKEYNLIKQMSEIIDELDQKLLNLFENKNEVTNVLIGSQNPLGNTCSFIYSFFNNGQSLFGLLGPIRMNYAKNISLIEYVNQNLK
jgi:heat-inducible transcriptional repressor